MNQAPDRPQPPTAPVFGDEDGDEFGYVIETAAPADPEAVTVVARLQSLAVAEAAYAAVVEERRGALVILRQGNRVLRSSGLGWGPGPE